jgi:hypothetical protein
MGTEGKEEERVCEREKDREKAEHRNTKNFIRTTTRAVDMWGRERT